MSTTLLRAAVVTLGLVATAAVGVVNTPAASAATTATTVQAQDPIWGDTPDGVTGDPIWG
ncbi:hypothetical protein ACFY93_12205 [Streptomyces sp. NPDC008313]|uniref:hypothetical protein n=1 Tax=Streptomyces sp. NPDC008313 TaxID=3364826 RepID=UPI0036F183DB